MPEDQVRPDEAAPAGLRPWTPPCVPPELLDDPSRLSHVVVDEIVGNTATIADYGLPDPQPFPDARARELAAVPTRLARLSGGDIDDLLRWGAVISDTAMRRRVPAPPVTPPTPGAPGGAASGPP